MYLTCSPLLSSLGNVSFWVLWQHINSGWGERSCTCLSAFSNANKSHNRSWRILKSNLTFQLHFCLNMSTTKLTHNSKLEMDLKFRQRFFNMIKAVLCTHCLDWTRIEYWGLNSKFVRVYSNRAIIRALLAYLQCSVSSVLYLNTVNGSAMLGDNLPLFLISAVESPVINCPSIFGIGQTLPVEKLGITSQSKRVANWGRLVCGFAKKYIYIND